MADNRSGLRKIIDRIARRAPVRKDGQLTDMSEENAEDPIEKEDPASGLTSLRALTRPLLGDEEKGRRDATRARELNSARERAKAKAFAPFEKK